MTKHNSLAVDAARRAKKDGASAAKRWLFTAQTDELVQLTAANYEYGIVLDELRHDHSVPGSRDRDFSWGFLQQVKSSVYHKLRRRDSTATVPRTLPTRSARSRS